MLGERNDVEYVLPNKLKILQNSRYNRDLVDNETTAYVDSFYKTKEPQTFDVGAYLPDV